MRNDMQNLDFVKPTDEFVRSLDVHTLLPQQEPFVMIGRLEHFDMGHVISSTEVSPQNLFVESGRMIPAGLIENIAQTCAARIGYVNKYILKKGIQIGFIGAVRDLRVHALPVVGDVIHTEVEVQEEVFGMILVTAVVRTVDRTCMTAELKIAIKE